MILVTVSYRKGARGEAYAQSMDHEAKHDAERCVSALKKRFPDWEQYFGIKQVVAAEYVVVLEAGSAHEITRQANFFAEGFMASAHLWER